MSDLEEKKRFLLESWDRWRQSGKGTAIAAFAVILLVIFLFSFVTVWGLGYLPGGAEEWGEVVYLLMALMMLVFFWFK